jgi:hypothetical protein
MITGMWRNAGIRLQPLEHFVAVHLRHHDIEEDEIDFGGPQLIECCLPARGDDNRVALPPQLPREHVAIRFDVIDHQHDSLRRVGCEIRERFGSFAFAASGVGRS